MSSTVAGSILTVLGALAMLGAVLNWKIVTRSGKLLNIALGDMIARVIYFGVGAFLFARGIGIMIGANWF